MKHRFTFLLAFCLMAFSVSAQLVDVVTGINKPWSLALKGNDLYITVDGDGKIAKIDLTQQPNPPVIDVLTGQGTTPFGGMIIQGDDLYFALYQEGKVKKLDLSLPNPIAVDVATGFVNPNDVLVNGTDMYVANQSASYISKVDLTQPFPPTLTNFPIGTFAFGLALKGNFLYFSDSNFGEISKIDITQTNPTPVLVAGGLGGTTGLTFNGNFLYFAGVNKIRRIDVSIPNPTPEDIVMGLNFPLLCAFDGQVLYISENGGNKISKLTIAQPVFSALGTICANAVPTNLGGASPTGGTYSGPGVTNNGNGETFAFNPAAAGGPGTYTITYTAINGSMVTSMLTVAEAPVVSVSTDGSILLDFGTVPISDGSPAGGTYSGPGVLPGNLFDPYLAGVGIYTITYTYTAANGCSGSDSFIVTVTPGANDACGGATSIDNLLGGALNVPQVSTEFNNTGYTTAGDPSTGYDCFVDQGGPSLEHTLWYTFVGDGSKYRIRSVNCNNATPYNDDTQVAIYAGACNSLSPVACNDDENAPAQVYNFSVEVATQAGTAYRMLVDGYGGTEGRFCLEVTRLGLSAVIDISQTSIQVFPNPTEGDIQLRNVTAEMVEVFDNMGRLVLSEVNPGSNLDISQTAAGVYFLKIYADGQVYSTKVVKQ